MYKIGNYQAQLKFLLTFDYRKFLVIIFPVPVIATGPGIAMSINFTVMIKQLLIFINYVATVAAGWPIAAVLVFLKG